MAVRDGQRKGWSPSFLDFAHPLKVWWAPIKEASGDWALLIPIQINFLADRSVSPSRSLFFRLLGREGGWDFSFLVSFRLFQSPKRQMKSWSLLFHDNNHLVTPHIKLNLSYMSLQINLCQPLFDSLHSCLSAVLLQTYYISFLKSVQFKPICFSYMFYFDFLTCNFASKVVFCAVFSVFTAG